MASSARAPLVHLSSVLSLTPPQKFYLRSSGPSFPTCHVDVVVVVVMAAIVVFIVVVDVNVAIIVIDIVLVVDIATPAETPTWKQRDRPPRRSSRNEALSAYTATAADICTKR